MARGTTKAARPTPVDVRKQLFNRQEVGPIERIQLLAVNITSLHAILYDIDPHMYRNEIATEKVRSSPRLFFAEVLEPLLQRDDVLRRAEVRDSGTGLHVLIRIEPAIEFESVGERERWSGVVKVVQAALPTDPRAPGITATTRATGSINSKNGRKVRRLKEGTPVKADEILALFERLRDRPFRTVANVLFGGDHITPCPSCHADGSSLVALDRIGQCYRCGKVPLSALYDHFLVGADQS